MAMRESCVNINNSGRNLTLMPSLPLELERLVFELAAFRNTDHDSRAKLSLVCKRVYDWTRPILYRVAIARKTPKGKSTIRNWGGTRITGVAPLVQHLFIDSSQVHAIELLSTFHNTENLAIWFESGISPKILEKMNDLPLRVLSVILGKMRLCEVIGYCPAFRNTTHLEIISNEGLTRGDVNQLVNFPNLTHLCFDVDGAPVDQSVLGLLEHRPSLQAMVYQTSRNCAIEVDDSRFLVLQGGMGKEDFVAEWERSANGGNGLWELVDKIIEARKNNLFKDNPYFFSRKTWMYNLNEDGIRWCGGQIMDGRITMTNIGEIAE